MVYPFDRAGITRDAAVVARYNDRPSSLVAVLQATFDKSPHHEAVVELGGERANFRQLWDRSARVAGGLRTASTNDGDRVAIRIGNGLDWCLAFFATQMAGAVAVPVNTRLSESEVEYVVSDSGSRFSFLPGQPLPDGEHFVVEDLSRDDLAAIFDTGGTTGFPKGAMITHENFLANTGRKPLASQPQSWTWI